MVVGLPGTGIGGLFYLLMTLWMPFHELYVLARGKSSLARWRFIAFNLLMVGAILSCLWATMLVMKATLAFLGLDRPKGLLEGADLAPALASEATSFMASAGWASAMSLVVLMVVVQVMRLTLGRSAKMPGAALALPGPMRRPGVL